MATQGDPNMQVNARTFQILAAVRQATVSLSPDGTSGLELPTPGDLHAHVLKVRDMDRNRYGKAYMSPSFVEESVTRLVDADLLQWAGQGLVLSPKASVMVDALDAGEVDPFEDQFFDDYKEQVALSALTYLWGITDTPPQMTSLCDITQMSDQSLRRGLTALKDKGKIEVLTETRLHVYKLLTIPAREDEDEPSVDEILGLNDNDGPITVADLDLAAQLTVGDTVIPASPKNAVVVDEGAAELTEGTEEPLELEHLSANLEWIRVPSEIQRDFISRARASGMTLTEFMTSLNDLQQNSMRSFLLGD